MPSDRGLSQADYLSMLRQRSRLSPAFRHTHTYTHTHTCTHTHTQPLGVTVCVISWTQVVNTEILHTHQERRGERKIEKERDRESREREDGG